MRWRGLTTNLFALRLLPSIYQTSCFFIGFNSFGSFPLGFFGYGVFHSAKQNPVIVVSIVASCHSLVGVLYQCNNKDEPRIVSNTADNPKILCFMYEYWFVSLFNDGLEFEDIEMF